MAGADPRYGNHGRYLRIDLSTGRSDFRPLPGSDLIRFLGGCGLGTYLLLREDAADAPPLSAEAVIVFAFGPLVGTSIGASARFAVVSRSPLTERINDSMAAGRFAVAGKATGADALVITGRATEPSVLLIDNGQVRIAPATDLWGRNCGDAQREIRDRLGDEYAVAVIGPAGERRVRFANIAHGSHYAGRGGSGAVLGSKNIKAVAVRGERCCATDRPDKLAAIADSLAARSVGPATVKYRELGAISNLLALNRLHALPSWNFQWGSVGSEAAKSLEVLADSSNAARRSCPGCKVACERFVEPGRSQAARDPRGVDSDGVRMTYENLFALGPLRGIEDPQIITAACRLCNELGMDTISTGGSVAFAMECVERGVLDASWLRFGDGNALLRVNRYHRTIPPRSLLERIDNAGA